MASSPAFAATMRAELESIATANANRDGTGTIATLITGAAGGTLVQNIFIKASVTTTAGMIRFFVSEDGGTTWVLWREVLVSAITPSATVAAFEASLLGLNKTLPNANWKIGVSTEKAETFKIHVDFAGDM